MPAVSTPLLVTPSDIAALAQVRRPVVSVWRSRFAGTDHPFPPAVDRNGGRDVFRLDDVVAWLEQTGHGNNPTARQDAAASAALDLLPPADRQIAVDGLVALLALKGQLGTTLTGLRAVDLADLADDVDPDDRCLYREIARLGAEAVTWAEHADALASAAFTPSGAVAALVARHRRLGLEDVGNHTLAQAVLLLVAQLADELTRPVEAVPTLVAPFGDADLVLAVGAHRGEAGTVILPALAGPAARHARRMLLAAGWDVADAAHDDGVVLPPAGATVLAAVPSATRPGMTDAEVVDALGEVEATLPPDGHAIVVGPALALCGRLPRSPQAARAAVLRSGRVRAVVRLPAGLRPSRVRQKLGLWLIGPGASDVRAPDHRTAIADLSATPLEPAVLDDLVTDLVTAAPGGPEPGAHAFRFARMVTTTSIVAASGDLMTARPTSRRARTDPTALALSVSELHAQATADGPALTLWQVVPGEAAGPTLVSLGRLVELGHLRLVAGNRIDEHDLSDGPGVPVHTPHTLTTDPPTPHRTISRLHLTATYPRSRDTQPGDIVFCTAPRPAAVVDRDGLGIVATPARVLRRSPTAPPGLLPEVVAHTISSAAPAGDWRHWLVPLVPMSQTEPVRRALSEIADARAATAARLAALDALTTRLVEGTTTGSVSLAPPRAVSMEG